MHRPPRIEGFTYTGPYAYMITSCTHLRASTFLDGDFARTTLLHFRQAARANAFEILAYCLMPNHAHFLVRGVAAHADLRPFVRIAKQRSGFEFARRTGGSRLWQEGYHDRVLRDADAILSVARYIVENPVRAGLVAQAEDYEHSGSDVWTIGEILEAACWERRR